MTQVFSKEWFAHHQSKLLWLLNAPIIGRWFKWVLCIRRCDIGYNKPIVKLLPNSYFVFLGQLENEDIELASDIRVRNKFANRLYDGLYPIWWLAHMWDLFVADFFVPKLSFGFASLSCYPSPGEVSPCDGNVNRNVYGSPESFAVIRAGTGTSAQVGSHSYDIGLMSGESQDLFATLSRLFFSFDLPPIETPILTATLSIFGNTNNVPQAKTLVLGSSFIHVCGAFPNSTSTLIISDFDKVYRTSFGYVDADVWGAEYNNFVFNSDGLNYIIPGKVNSFSLQIAWDLNNSFDGSWVYSASSTYSCCLSDGEVENQAPKLTLTFIMKGFNTESFRCLGNISVSRKLGGLI